MKQSDLETTIQALIDGELSSSEERTIVSKIKTDPKALSLYQEYAHIDSSLARLAGGQIPLSDKSGSVIDASQKFRRRRNLTKVLVAVAAIAIAFIVTLKFILVSDPPLLAIKKAPDTHYTVTHSRSEKSDTPKKDELALG